MIGQDMVANRAIKQKAREYAQDFGVDYPRALAEITAPGPAVPFTGLYDRDRFGFDPLTDRHLILTGAPLVLRSGLLERLIGRLFIKPDIELFMIDITGDLLPRMFEGSHDGSTGTATTPEAAAMVIRNVILSARMAHEVQDDRRIDILAINGLHELVQTSPECAELLGELRGLIHPRLSLVLASEQWIGNTPVDGAKTSLPHFSRLHFGPLGEMPGVSPMFVAKWEALAPGEYDAVYRKAGCKPIKASFLRPAQEQVH